MRSGRKQKTRHRRATRAVSGGTTRLIKPAHTAQPLGESNRTLEPPAHCDGIMRQDAKGWRVPDALIEASGTAERGLMPGRFMSTVTILVIIFITIITWF